MGFEPYNEAAGIASALGVEPKAPDPNGPSLLGAAFRQSNIVGSLGSMLYHRGVGFEDDPDHNPLDLIKDTRYGSVHLDQFIGSRSEAETRAIMRQIDAEEADKEVLANSGAGGLLAAVGVGVVDPTILLPGGALYRASQMGVRAAAARSAMSVGAWAAAGAAAQEAILQPTQVLRTAEDGALSVAAATVVGGILGGSVSRLMSAAERRAVAAAIDADYVRPATSSPSSAGAAASDMRTGQLATYGLDQVPGVSEVYRRASPVTDVLQSPSLSARRTMLDLAETPLVTRDALEGVAQTAGGAVSRTATMEQRRGMMRLDEIMDSAFQAHRFGEQKVAGVERAAVADMIGHTPAGKMGVMEFREEVTKALRAGGEHAVPEVAEAAKAIRTDFYDAYRERLQKAGLLPDDLNADEQARYVNRLWNVDLITARQDEFRSRVVTWLEKEQSRKSDIQARVEAIDGERRAAAGIERALSARLERVEGRIRELAARGDEAARAATTAEGRASINAARAEAMAEVDAGLEETLRLADGMTGEARGRIEDLRRQYARLAREEQKARVGLDDLDRIDAEEVAGVMNDKITRMAADIMTGKREGKKPPSLIRYVAANYGINDKYMRGEESHLAEMARIPGLINHKTGWDFDKIGEALGEMMQGVDGYRPTVAEVIDLLHASARGIEPEWFVRRFPETDESKAADYAEWLGAAMSNAGIAAVSRRDVALAISGGAARHIEPAVWGALDSELASLERAAAAASPSAAMGATAEAIDRQRAMLAQLRRDIRLAEQKQARAKKSGATAGGRAEEAGLLAGRSEKRSALLSERQSIAERKMNWLNEAIAVARSTHESAIVRIEDEVAGWGGKSAREALAAIKARDNAALAKEVAERTGAADDAITLAARRILSSDQTLSRQEVEALANQIVSNIKGTPAGRLWFRDGGDVAGVASEMGDLRGPLARRAFAIPDDLVEDFLVNDVEQVMRAYMRTVIPDLALAEKFGSVDLKQQIRQIEEEFQELIAKAPAKQRASLEAERIRVIEKVAGVRDRVRGTYGWSDSTIARNIGRWGMMIHSYNMMTDLGTAALNSLGDIAGAVFRYGFTKVAGEGWAPFAASLAGVETGFRESRRQLQAMAVANDIWQATKGRSIADLQHAFQPQSRFERAVYYGGEKFNIVNLQAYWTDFAKTVAGTVAMNEFYRASKAVVAGTATQKQVAMLAAGGIDAAMARRVFEQFDASKNVVGTTHLPNTEKWSDDAARDAFENALAREVEIAVVTPGQEKPLWMSTAVGRLLGQHKSFIAGANERILLANLQRRDAATLSGLLTAVSGGMMSAAIYSAVSGKKPPERPQDWIKEGVSKSGVMGWFEEANTIAAKATRGQADVFRLIGADKPLSRFSNNSLAGQLMGPSFGKVEKLAGVVGDVSAGETDARTIAKTRQLVPLQNLWGLRLLLNKVEDAAASQIGVAPLERR